jgi:hypothetical protein
MKFREQKAVRSGNWKYLSIEGNEFLYDLARDPRDARTCGSGSRRASSA